MYVVYYLMRSFMDECRIDGQGIKIVYNQNINHESNLSMPAYFGKGFLTGAPQAKTTQDHRDRPTSMSLPEIRKLVEEIMG